MADIYMICPKCKAEQLLVFAIIEGNESVKMTCGQCGGFLLETRNGRRQ